MYNRAQTTKTILVKPGMVNQNYILSRCFEFAADLGIWRTTLHW